MIVESKSKNSLIWLAIAALTLVYITIIAGYGLATKPLNVQGSEAKLIKSSKTLKPIEQSEAGGKPNKSHRDLGQALGGFSVEGFALNENQINGGGGNLSQLGSSLSDGGALGARALEGTKSLGANLGASSKATTILFSPILNADYGFFTTLIHDTPPFPTFWGAFSHRFFPAAHLDFIAYANILKHFNALSYINLARFIYVANILELIILVACFASLLLSALKVSSTSLWFALPCVFILLFNSATLISYMGFCFPERLLLMFLALFLVFHTKFLRSRAGSLQSCVRPLRAGSLGSALLALLFGNIMLYYKEPAFAILGALGVMGLLAMYLAHKNRGKRIDRAQAYYYLVLIISAIIFLLAYVFFVHSQHLLLSSSYTATSGVRVLVFYALNDPVPVLLLVLLLCIRGVELYKGFKADGVLMLCPLIDGLLLGALAYLIILIIMRVIGMYYIAPLYILCLLATAYMADSLKGALAKIALLVILLSYLASSLPFTLSLANRTLGASRAEHAALGFIKGYLQSHKGARIFTGTADLSFIATALKSQYDVKNFTLALTKSEVAGSVDARASVKSGIAIEATPHRGDLVLFTPLSDAFLTKATFKNLKANYNEVFSYHYFYIPRVDIKALLKYLALRRSGEAISGSYKNIFNYPNGVLVFERK